MRKVILEKKLEEIKEIIKNELSKHQDNNLIFERYNKFLKSFTEKNVAVAIISDNVVENPDFRTRTLFALSNWNVKEEIDNYLIDSLKTNNIEVCFENINPYYKFRRLNENLEFKNVPKNLVNNSFMEKKKTCCERKFIEYIKDKHVNWKLSEFEQSSNYSKSEEGVAQKHLDAHYAELEGTIEIYTRLEPCIYCFDLLRKFKSENPKLILKVYHGHTLEESERHNELFIEMENNFKQTVKSFVIVQTSSTRVNVANLVTNIFDNLLPDQQVVLNLIDKINNSDLLSNLILEITGDSPEEKLAWVKNFLEKRL